MKKETKALITLLTFFLLALVLSPIVVSIFKMDPQNITIQDNMIYNAIYEFVLCAIVLVLNWEIVKKGIKKCAQLKKENHMKDFLAAIVKAFIVCLLVNLGVSLFVSCFGELIGVKGIIQSNNQTSVTGYIKYNPLLMASFTCIFAPIAEELVFRGAIGELVKNKKVFIAVSGLIFGLVHVTDSASRFILAIEFILMGYLISKILNISSYSDRKKKVLSVAVSVIILILFGFVFRLEFGNLLLKIKSLNASEVLSSLSYIAFGSMFAYYYQKHDNILFSIGIHIIQNTLSVVLLLFL